VTVLLLMWTWVMGGLVVCMCWPRALWRRDAGIIIALSLGVGLGVTSGFFYLASLTSRPTLMSGLSEAVLAIALTLYLVLREKRAASTQPAESRLQPVDKPARWLRIGFWLVLSCGAPVIGTVITRAWLAEPYGGWDAWAIWNMRARILTRVGENWPWFSAQATLAWTHPDYPLLVSASVARGWAWLGKESALYSGAASIAFTLATAGLLGAMVQQLAGFRAAAIGSLVFLSTPSILVMASQQHADLPLGYFYLASLSLIVRARQEPRAPGLHGLAGLCLGLAAWTKNEGLLFAGITTLVLLAEAGWRRHTRGLKAMAVGAAVGLFPVLAFKLLHAPANDIISGARPLIESALDLERHRIIAQAFWREGLGFGGWPLSPIPLMIVGLGLASVRRARADHTHLGPIVISLLLTGCGYYAVYLLTPHDLAWHLNFSLTRLYQQLWPTVIFIWCGWVLSVKPDRALHDKKIGQPSRTRTTIDRLPWRWLAPILLMLTLSTTWALSLQPKDRELASLRLGGGLKLVSTPNEGWFGVEKNAQHEWLWSQGVSTLHLHREGQGTPQRKTFGLRFGLRSLDHRSLKILLGDRLIWEGHSDIPLRTIEVQDLAVPEATTSLLFISEAPGVPEADTPEARSLTFAIYDLELVP
jgi:hypothetical protein